MLVIPTAEVHVHFAIERIRGEEEEQSQSAASADLRFSFSVKSFFLCFLLLFGYSLGKNKIRTQRRVERHLYTKYVCSEGVAGSLATPSHLLRIFLMDLTTLATCGIDCCSNVLA